MVKEKPKGGRMDIQDMFGLCAPAVVARNETNLNAVETAVVARNEIESERARKSFLERNKMKPI